MKSKRSKERKGQGQLEHREYGAKRAKWVLNPPSHGVISLPNGAERSIWGMIPYSE
jgi:hypothetical protein